MHHAHYHGRYPLVSPSLVLDFISGGGLDPRLTFTRASSANFFGSNGQLQSASTNVPRFDYDPTTLAPLGLLIEQQVVDDSRYSSSIAAGAAALTWALVTMTAADTSVGITGAINSATRLTATNTNGTALGTLTLSAATHAFCPWIKRVTGTGNVQITQDGVSYTTVTLGSGWTPVTPLVASQLNPVIGFRLATSGDAIDVCFAGLQAVGFRTSPIGPTTTASVTRAADVCSILTSAFPFNEVEYTLVFKGLFPNNSSQIIQLDDGSGNNRVAFTRSSGGLFNPFVVSGGSTVATLTQGAMSSSVADRMAVAVAANNFASCLNGGSVVTDVAGAVPVAPTTLRLVATSSGVSGAGWAQQLAYYPTRLPNNALQALTA